MSILLAADPGDEDVLRLVETWIDALARGDFAGAYAMTEHDPYYAWTPDLIRDVIAGYGLPTPHPSGEAFAVTPRARAEGTPADRAVDPEARRPGALAEVRYSLPLNDEWSDLTATFGLERVALPRLRR
jgi:hypothetical protein